MSAVGFVLRDLLVGYGYFAVLIVVAAENLGLPLPGETILVTAAIYAGTTHVLRLPLIILAASAGALAGSSAAFAIGRRYGDALVGRYGRYIRLDEAKMRLGRYLFMRYGGAIVFLGRFVAFLRALAGLLAGVNRMTTGGSLGFSIRRQRLFIRGTSRTCVQMDQRRKRRARHHRGRCGVHVRTPQSNTAADACRPSTSPCRRALDPVGRTARPTSTRTAEALRSEAKSTAWAASSIPSAANSAYDVIAMPSAMHKRSAPRSGTTRPNWSSWRITALHASFTARSANRSRVNSRPRARKHCLR